MGNPVIFETRRAEPTLVDVAQVGRDAPLGDASPSGHPSPGGPAWLRAVRRLRLACGSAVSALRGLPAWVLLIQLFIGAGWLRAAVEKVLDPTWWGGTTIRVFVADHAPLTLPWYRSVVDILVLPNVILVAVLVVLAQLLAGAALITGRHVRAGLMVGIFVNLNFVAAGAVNPSIFYLVCQAALLLWMLQFRTPSGIAGHTLRWLPAASIALFALSAPFIASFDPAAVIGDPAMVLAFFGGLLAVSIWLAADPSTSEAQAVPVRAVPVTAPSEHPASVRSSGGSCFAVTWVGPTGFACATDQW